MNHPPRVSILLACRDAATTVDAALTSLTSQTFHDLEIVAVDDGSEDGTAERLQAWSAQDCRVQTIQTPPAGIVSALNAAAERARGTILVRMDADDIAASERIERQVRFLDAHPNLTACGTGVRYFPRGSVREGARRYEAWINSVVTPDQIERDLFVECPIPHPTLAVQRKAFDQVGGYRDVAWAEDYDLILRLWQAGYRFGKVAAVLLRWRERPDRLSRTDPRYGPAAFRECKAHFLESRIRSRPVVVWGAGPVGKAFARVLQTRGQEIVAFVDLDPRKIGQIIHGAPVIPPAMIAEYRSAYVLAAVGSAKGRAQIRRSLSDCGFSEPQDACAIA